MSQLIDRQEMAIRYLLGTLSDEERTGLEQQFFSNDQVFEELEIAEDELIDRYVREELSPDDRRRFTKLLVSPRLSERVELAKILAQKVYPAPPVPVVVTQEQGVPKPPVEPPWWKKIFEFSSLSPGYRAAFAGALSLLMLLSVAIFFVSKRSREESQRLAAEQQQQEERRRREEQTPANEKPEGTPEQAKEEKEDKEEQLQPPKEYQQKPKEPRRPTVASVFPYYVPTSGTRSGGDATKPLELKKDASTYELRLDVSGGNYSRYNARLEDLNRNPIYQPASLKPTRHRRGIYIHYQVAAEALTPGSYIVHVDGIHESGEVIDFQDYPFRVVAR